MEKSLKEILIETMKKRGVKVPALSKQTGIPADRIYKWFNQGSNPKEQDSVIIEKWINKSNVPHGTRELASDETDYKEKFYLQLQETNKLLKDLAEAKERCIYLENVIKANLEKSLSNQFLMMRQIAVASRMIVENASHGDQKKLQEGLSRIDKLVSSVRE